MRPTITKPGQVEQRLDDAELARRARAGSLDALGELYERHAPAVYAVALRLLAAPADAEDVLQDVFVGLPAALQRYEERGSLGAWLRRVAARRALMTLRRARFEGEARALEPPPVAPAGDATRRLAARAAIAGLPAALRTVFVLKEVEGYSHAEIGALLDITARASALRLHRAWKILGKRTGAP